MSGDPGWIDVHGELVALHVEKAGDYGNADDALANYVLTSRVSGQVDEFTCWLRIHEKCIRALNMIAAGREDELDEGVDVAALAIGAEALKRRRRAVWQDDEADVHSVRTQDAIRKERRW